MFRHTLPRRATAQPSNRPAVTPDMARRRVPSPPRIGGRVSEPHGPIRSGICSIRSGRRCPNRPRDRGAVTPDRGWASTALSSNGSNEMLRRPNGHSMVTGQQKTSHFGGFSAISTGGTPVSLIPVRLRVSRLSGRPIGGGGEELPLPSASDPTATSTGLVPDCGHRPPGFPRDRGPRAPGGNLSFSTHTARRVETKPAT